MAKTPRLSSVTTATLTVKWSNLLKPDVAFGEASANHNITVVVDNELKAQLDNILKQSKSNKINGLKEQDGVLTLKAKSKISIDKGRYPCVDSMSNPTDAVPFGGDTVRLKLQPCLLARDNSVSFYLNGIQIITKELKNTTTNNSFEVVKDGFVTTDNPVTNTVLVGNEDSDLPF